MSLKECLRYIVFALVACAQNGLAMIAAKNKLHTDIDLPTPADPIFGIMNVDHFLIWGN